MSHYISSESWLSDTFDNYRVNIVTWQLKNEKIYRILRTLQVQSKFLIYFKILDFFSVIIFHIIIYEKLFFVILLIYNQHILCNVDSWFSLSSTISLFRPPPEPLSPGCFGQQTANVINRKYIHQKNTKNSSFRNRGNGRSIPVRSVY